VVDVLVILDGASEARGTREPTLEVACTPALDALAAGGECRWATVLPPGVPVGSETAIAALLGWVPSGPVDRGAVEAAARGIEVPPGRRAWRLDVGVRPHRHKLVLVSGEEPQIGGEAPVTIWPPGALPPRILDATTVVVGAAGAATGLAALMGAGVVIPEGATGRPDSDLAAKLIAARNAIAAGAQRVVVHVGGPDEAAHERDREAKIAAIEAADRNLIGPLHEIVAATGGSLTVSPDHGCDPETGMHVAGPVPTVSWSTARVAR
jgi:2,3-bisphosphoglycerate-independent phosphoglycerate mutase